MERERRSREYWEQELSEYWDSMSPVTPMPEVRRAKFLEFIPK